MEITKPRGQLEAAGTLLNKASGNPNTRLAGRN